VIRTDEVGLTTRMVDPANLSPSQIRQVLGPDGLRDEAEQIAIMERKGSTPLVIDTPKKIGKIKVDRRRVGLVVGRAFLSASVVVDSLSRLHVSEIEPLDELDKTVAVKLTEDEHQALNLAASRVGVSMATLARRALITAGLLRMPEGL
jgi:hypothetical protein